MPHAYLFSGPAHSGKYTTALALAAALNCDEEPGEGCGACASCERIAAGIHPDVRTLERQGAALAIPIETIRREVVPAMAMPPHEGHARVFLIEEATSLHGPAANALLKTLEEPPPRTHFVLGTTAPEMLLPTIRSRCQRVSFSELPEDLRALIEDDDDTGARLDELARSMLDALEDKPAAVYRASAEVARDRTEVAPALRLLGQRLHHRARAAALECELSRASVSTRQARLVSETERAVALHNAHGQLAVEHLLFQLRAAQR